MEALKNITKFLWLPIVAVALWIIYKIFVKSPQDENGDQDFNNTTQNTGLSPTDLSIYNQVLSNLRNAVRYESPEFHWYDFIVMPFSGAIYATDNLSATQGAYSLAELLSKVTDKQQFSETFYKKQKVTLDSAIVKIYGDVIYGMISKNVPNFNEFIL